VEERRREVLVVVVVVVKRKRISTMLQEGGVSEGGVDEELWGRPKTIVLIHTYLLQVPTCPPLS
jgi:hypothetical protein